jgi:hypothetical protein
MILGSLAPVARPVEPESVEDRPERKREPSRWSCSGWRARRPSQGASHYVLQTLAFRLNRKAGLWVHDHAWSRRGIVQAESSRREPYLPRSQGFMSNSLRIKPRNSFGEGARSLPQATRRNASLGSSLTLRSSMASNSTPFRSASSNHDS